MVGPPHQTHAHTHPNIRPPLSARSLTPTALTTCAWARACSPSRRCRCGLRRWHSCSPAACTQPLLRCPCSAMPAPRACPCVPTRAPRNAPPGWQRRLHQRAYQQQGPRLLLPRLLAGRRYHLLRSARGGAAEAARPRPRTLARLLDDALRPHLRRLGGQRGGAAAAGCRGGGLRRHALGGTRCTALHALLPHRRSTSWRA
jgi:hypothetical protein